MGEWCIGVLGGSRLYANDALHRKEGVMNALDMSAVVFQPTLLIQDVMG